MTEDAPDPINTIREVCGMSGSWYRLESTGLANRIYATRDVVVRIATDHEEAFSDARTESVAAPVAHAAGLLTPRLLVFDDSRQLLDRPYSVWERVNGKTLGRLSPDPHSMSDTWRQVGSQLALLHVRVKQCDDPNGYLDKPERNLSLDCVLEKLASTGNISRTLAKEISLLIDELHSVVLKEAKSCFLHNDLHDMNIMCTRGGQLMALIDWGDAGWGDPTIEFAQIPLPALPYVLEGYREVAPDLLGGTPEARIIWDKLDYAMMESLENPSHIIPMEAYKQFLNAKGDRFKNPMLGLANKAIQPDARTSRR